MFRLAMIDASMGFAPVDSVVAALSLLDGARL
ncbi:hypothetical protein H4W32_004007 [Actinophytocola algeriensis]|uniref:Uncharacterized protein n=1 Tax=Actinophytocola algeriensis TaxID=1768010 RepID=A0A7W7VHD7_9PSEU|nr:hypothetical protein [Actinophytocola algeriensis]MBE1475965.1 hypothetical protein [Actinophytocola algeriensis]